MANYDNFFDMQFFSVNNKFLLLKQLNIIKMFNLSQMATHFEQCQYYRQLFFYIS